MTAMGRIRVHIAGGRMIHQKSWLLAVILAAGCAPGNPGLVIANVLAPGDSCVFDVGGVTLGGGTLDVAGVQTSYVAQVRLLNQLLNLGTSGSGGPPMADPNLINLVEAEIELQDGQGGTIPTPGPNPFAGIATGFSPSSTGSTVGEGVGTIEIIPAGYGAALRGSGITRVIAVIRAVGVTTGGAELVSNEFIFPIDICEGCLFACVLDRMGEPQCEPACRAGQDELTISCFATAPTDTDPVARPLTCIPAD
jgi:hypothetical protein